MPEQNRHHATRNQEEMLEVARRSSERAGTSATVISTFALLFSGYTFYETVLRAPELDIYVPPRIEYTDPDRPDSPFEVFILPITLTNDGARAGTILSIDLDVTNPRTNQSKKFYAANLGLWGTTPRRPFAPVALSGKMSYSEAVQFYPREGETVARIVDSDPGEYRLKLSLRTTGWSSGFLQGGKPKPLEFKMKLGKMDYRYFYNNGTMPMWSANYQPASTKTE